ncbi:hypothetical protein KTO58_01235 [Chitinophaga pendula]|uniref:hypothetical protein n=1 Tax=Chitinophaga TaxID=79328 RepID=UPI000BAF0D42|nr:MULTISPECIES: hypothetical protein [Chitinophaga]ASZ14514.1 hypothetical protein CK934_27985 [Chitinophaga sp. MD30]UCJ07829.1 hypothetical protein KTO58_01235 [Chitinophaga pendula]
MDKKLNLLDPAGPVSGNDIIGIVQDMATGKMLYTSAQALKSFVLGGATAGARIYFSPGVPGVSVGVDNDVAFDTQGKGMYLKISGRWILQDFYGSTGGMQRIAAIIPTERSSYQNSALADSEVLDVSLDGIGLKERTTSGTLAQDEWRQNKEDPSIVNFGQVLPAGVFIRILYNV